MESIPTKTEEESQAQNNSNASQPDLQMSFEVIQNQNLPQSPQSQSPQANNANIQNSFQYIQQQAPSQYQQFSNSNVQRNNNRMLPSRQMKNEVFNLQ